MATIQIFKCGEKRYKLYEQTHDSHGIPTRIGYGPYETRDKAAEKAFERLAESDCPLYFIPDMTTLGIEKTEDIYKKADRLYKKPGWKTKK
jgi:hypothetical protein